ncbi:MAG: lipopolysaccharide transport periplasmic protein LptA [Thermodesulfobacteriota bacterium]
METQSFREKSTLSRFALIICLLVFATGFGLAGLAAASFTGDEPGRVPIHIEADRMESDQQREAVVFAGNVEASQGELLIRADEMTVYYRKSAEDDGPGKDKSIDNLQATGNVKIIKKDWVATGDLVEYKAVERKVVLTGNTKVFQDNNMVTGDRVVLFLDEGKSVVEKQGADESGRVKAFFYPEKANDNNTNQ